jgi:hypothetical protein
MPEEKTEITEIVTGLGMLGEKDLDRALFKIPAALENVTDEKWINLKTLYSKGSHRELFEISYRNGRDFLESDDGLRNRLPVKIEWKGNHRGPSFELVPADLRVDRVYLVSCKFFSKILLNSGPEHLFEECLKRRPEKSGEKDWYALTGGRYYLNLYQETRKYLRDKGIDLKSESTDLYPGDRAIIKKALQKGKWPEPLLRHYNKFCDEVSEKSSVILNANLKKENQKLEFFWRLIRLQAAPYFLLGSCKENGKTKPLKLRVDTPWDWNNNFELISFKAFAKPGKGQPIVEWKAEILVKGEKDPVVVIGHVEIRWSHGKFCSNPEAKVYLDTPHEKVPGYWPLA